MTKEKPDVAESKPDVAESKPDVTNPVDDAKIVHDEAAEEKAHDDLVADVAKLLEQPGDTPEKPGEEKPPEEPPKGEGEKEKAKESATADSATAESSLSKELQTRAERAGISTELAEQLHQSGQLEDVVAMSDRRMIQYVQAHSADAEAKESPKGDESKGKLKAEADQDAPKLNEDIWDEDIRKDFERLDAYQRNRIDALEAQVQQMAQGSDGGFDEWFDSSVDALNRDDLFGKGTSVSRSKQSNRDAVFQAYGAICAIYGVDPNDRNPEMTQFAFEAEFREEFKEQLRKQVKKEEKEKQQQQLSRTRDAEGKFVSSPTSKGGPPPKGATDEEVHEHLVSNVAAYMKEQGVQMSGYY